jgi:hypothetical protein
MSRLEALTKSLTDCVRLWLFAPDDPDGGFAVQRYGRGEARQIASEADNIEDAARSLENWFIDRLTVDPGIPGPFGGLAYDLISSALDLVDWGALAAEVRTSPPER